MSSGISIHRGGIAWSLTAGRGEDVFDRMPKVVVHGVCVSLLRSLEISHAVKRTTPPMPGHLPVLPI